jgi:2-methylcitrate dehydratase PrpD
MCLPFSVALAAKIALAPGEVPALTVADYEAGLGDRLLYDLEERMTIGLDPQVEAASNALSTAAKVDVLLRDGRAFSAFVAAPKGSAGHPLSAQEHAARFTQELSRRVPEGVCDEIIRMARDLDRLDPRRLGELLSGG